MLATVGQDMAAVETASAEDPEYTRLHITPFDLSLQNVVLPASVLPRARNISYHTIETFPEKRFGFVDLPTMDAEKLKKKLNGAVLKGAKVRIETARPESVSELAVDIDPTNKKTKKEKKKSKKRKHEADDVIEGVQLEGRKVKRGWTTTEQELIEEKRKKARKEKTEKKLSKDEKKDKIDKKKKRPTVKSKYTDEAECLFKTKLPGPAPSTDAKETEEDEEASTQKKKRKRKSDREVIVHEFEKTTKYPTFLKSSSTTAKSEATTFQDDVGWVDSTGNVVEPVRSKRRPEGIPAPDPPQSKPKKATPTPREDKEEVSVDDDDETSSSGSSSSDEDDDTSSSGSDSNVSEKGEEITTPPKQVVPETPALNSPLAITKSESSRPKSSGSVTSLSIKIPPTTPAAKKIHPLEALYKRPQGGDGGANGGSETQQPFSFFGNEDDMEDDGESTAPASQQAPMTPFTKQEFEFRNIRSAAPTPDTAHPSRSFNFWASQGSGGDEDDDAEGLGDVEEEEEERQQEGEDEDVDMEGGDGIAAGGQTSQQMSAASDFQKQFWESRGDLNRAWRKRRKSAAKEKRYRDNRARAERAI
ncbi:hypothetical protein F5Y03DRAFT_368149 [Xylaria venustula]|nr:hypothetical protein F5Y03DRAFT_368149 [Xylaria venustula]